MLILEKLSDNYTTLEETLQLEICMKPWWKLMLLETSFKKELKFPWLEELFNKLKKIVAKTPLFYKNP